MEESVRISIIHTSN